MSDNAQLLQLIKQKTTNLEGDISLSPNDAWDIITKYPDVKLVDVRTNEERVFTGYVEASEHIPWATGTSFTRNPRFVREVEHKIGKQTVIFLLCRSGQRSKLAAQTLKTSGFEDVYNISEGFEGDLNEHNQRNQINGWKYHNLPWIQS